MAIVTNTPGVETERKTLLNRADLENKGGTEDGNGSADDTREDLAGTGGRALGGSGSRAVASLGLTITDLGNGRAGRSLGLAVANLRDGSAGLALRLAIANLRDGGASGALGLAVTDLRDGSAGLALGLAIANLADRGSRGSGGRSLELAVRNLADGGSVGRGLNLAVANLGHSGARRGVNLDLAVANLAANLAHGDGHNGGVDLGLAVADGRHNGRGDHLGADGLAAAVVAAAAAGAGAAARHGDNLNGRALGSPVAVVQVVERARQAAVEGGRATNCQGAVAAQGEAAVVDGAGLGRRAVKLELVVGDNGADAALGVGQDTVLELKDEVAGVGAVATSGELTLLVAHRVDGDLELAVGRRLAASGRSRGGSLGSGGAGHGDSDSRPLHCAEVLARVSKLGRMRLGGP